MYIFIIYLIFILVKKKIEAPKRCLKFDMIISFFAKAFYLRFIPELLG